MRPWSRRLWVPERLLPGELRLDMSDGIQHSLCPVFVLRVHHDHAETMVMAFTAHTFGIIDMQVDIEGWRKFRGRVRKPMRRQGVVMPNTVDHTVDADTVEQ